MQQLELQKTAGAASAEGDVQREGSGDGRLEAGDVLMPDVAAVYGINGTENLAIQRGADLHLSAVEITSGEDTDAGNGFHIEVLKADSHAVADAGDVADIGISVSSVLNDAGTVFLNIHGLVVCEDVAGDVGGILALIGEGTAV